MTYYTRTFDKNPGDSANEAELESEFDAVATGFQSVEGDVDNVVRFTNADFTAQTSAANAATRANSVIGFDGSGDLELKASYDTVLSDCQTAQTAAEAAQTAAEAAQTAAETAETNAETAETNAETAQANAETAQANAEAAETNAASAQGYAEEWANTAEDSLVSVAAGGDGATEYSARHWAAKAAAAATAYSADPGIENLLINGDMRFNQRGESYVTADGFPADRWHIGGLGTTWSSQKVQFDHTAHPIASRPDSYVVTAVTAGAGTSDYVLFGQAVEGVRNTAGRTLTLSYWAKANISSLKVAIETQQYMGTGGSAVNIDYQGQQTLTTGWVEYHHTFTLDDLSGATFGTAGTDCLYVFFWLDSGSVFDARNGGMGHQSGNIYIADVRLYFGGQQLDVERRGDAQELAMCQRYYQCSDIDNAGSTINWSGNNTVAVSYFAGRAFAVQMRAIPDVSGSSASASGFSTSINLSASAMGIRDVRASTSGGAGNYFRTHWEAEAEFF